MPSILSRLAGRAGFARAHPPTPMLAAKSSRTAALFGFNLPGLTRFQPRTSPELTRHGYERNPIVFRSVRMIAEAVASVPWLVYEQGMETPDHPLLAVLANPNAGQSGTELLEALVSNLLLFGNAYVEAVSIDGTLRELHALRPDRMSIVPGSNGWPAAFEYRAGAEKVRFDAGAGVSPILHLKFFAPLDDYYGHAPLAAAETALDIHNSASCWNRALLDNAARPSGALVYSGPEGATLSEEQFDRLKNELDESFSGARNAGRPLLLEGGLDWKPLSLSPKDMDFIEAKAAAAREIALAFGVPPMVLGLPGDNTFSNYQEANRAFWRQTIVPFVSRLQKSFEGWMQADFGTFELRANLDGVDALSSERSSEWARIGAASFLTDDEKREAVGYAPRGAKGTLPDGSFDGTPVDAGVDGGGGLDPGGNGGAWENQPRDDIGRWTSQGGGDQGNVPQTKPTMGNPVLLTKPDGTAYANPFVTEGDNRIFYPSNFGPDFFISKGAERSNEPSDLTLELIGGDLTRFRQGVEWDIQRLGGSGFDQKYVDYSSVAIGLYGASAGLSADLVLEIQNQYARFKSRYPKDTTFSTVYNYLPARNVFNTEIGYDIFKAGSKNERVGLRIHLPVSVSESLPLPQPGAASDRI